MGLSQEDKEIRREATKDIGALTQDPGDPEKNEVVKPYFFISYKSDDWEIVLDYIVRELVDKYGLRVYFDRNFDTSNDNWLKNMKKAIETRHCKGVLSFVSKKYLSSMPCALELLYTNDALAISQHSNKKIEVISVVIDQDYDNINDIIDNIGTKNVSINSDEFNALKEILNGIEEYGSDNKELYNYVKIINKNIDKSDITEEKVAKFAYDAMFTKDGAPNEKRLNIDGNKEQFIEDLYKTIKNIDASVYDSTLIGKCPKESNSINKEEFSKNDLNTIKNKDNDMQISNAKNDSIKNKTNRRNFKIMKGDYNIGTFSMRRTPAKIFQEATKQIEIKTFDELNKKLDGILNEKVGSYVLFIKKEETNDDKFIKKSDNRYLVDDKYTIKLNDGDWCVNGEWDSKTEIKVKLFNRILKIAKDKCGLEIEEVKQD